jgi:hypothetical protein
MSERKSERGCVEAGERERERERSVATVAATAMHESTEKPVVLRYLAMKIQRGS